MVPVDRPPGQPHPVEGSDAADLPGGPRLGLYATPGSSSRCTPAPSHTAAPAVEVRKSHTSSIGNGTVRETPISQPTSLVRPVGRSRHRTTAATAATSTRAPGTPSALTMAAVTSGGAIARRQVAGRRAVAGPEVGPVDQEDGHG